MTSQYNIKSMTKPEKGNVELIFVAKIALMHLFFHILTSAVALGFIIVLALRS
jgi:hypothetical protein